MESQLGFHTYRLTSAEIETRVDGKIAAPSGMMLNNEAWIVADFRSLANGVAEDLSAERAPLLREIQEGQNHVQRIQSDLVAREERIRLIRAQIQVAKANASDANVVDLQQRIDSTEAEEPLLKAELQQAQRSLAKAQTADDTLDDKYYAQLNSLPEQSVVSRIPLTAEGSFSWEGNNFFVGDEEEHRIWIFARATRDDGRQYWALHPFSVFRDKTLKLTIEPPGFISTKTILRPDLSPSEQAR